MTDKSLPLIRPARVEDAERCGDIAVAAWAPVYESFRRMVGDELFALQWPNWRDDKRGQVEGFIRKHTDWAIVTELDGAIAGFLTYTINAERGSGEIGNNAVDPGFQGYGIGTLQCERVLDIFREAGLKFATVYTGLDEAHLPARLMYAKAGFDLSTPHIRYYKRL